MIMIFFLTDQFILTIVLRVIKQNVIENENERREKIFKFQRQQTGKRKRQLGKEPIENEPTRRKNAFNQSLIRSLLLLLFLCCSTSMLIVRQSASEERTSQIEERIYSLEQKKNCATEKKKREEKREGETPSNNRIGCFFLFSYFSLVSLSSLL